MRDVSVGHKYFSTETTKLPAIFHYEVIIIFPRICLGINRMLEPGPRKITSPSTVIYVHIQTSRAAYECALQSSIRSANINTHVPLSAIGMRMPYTHSQSHSIYKLYPAFSVRTFSILRAFVHVVVLIAS